jgi:cytochrome c oxidase cbb3-type subunit 3
MSQGKMFFAAYNCTGCHAQGGGDKGPALMDDVWIYGADPANVFTSIVDGRPNGMPAFRDRIPEYQVWQLVAYVRSMSGLVSSDAAPGRNDAMQAKIPEQATDKQPPKQAVAPPGLAGSR